MRAKYRGEEAFEHRAGKTWDCRRVMIAAPKSGSGKTTVTCALLQALLDRGEKATAYKCGPDYIDPMFHKTVIGVPSCNLDTFFTGEKDTVRLFCKHASDGSIAVLEGVMGLFDGLGGVREEGSSYHLAKVTGTPILLVADVKGMGRSILPFLAGFLQYDTEHLIRGVVLNRVSGAFFETIKPLIEEELNLPVAGFLPDQERFRIDSRHLGLVRPEEIPAARKKLSELAKVFTKTVSLSAVCEIATGAEVLSDEDSAKEREEAGEGKKSCGIKETESALKEGGRAAYSPVIAVARDEAFCFYYEDNLMLLEEYGARLVFFSPLHDKKLPEGCQGLLLGGGYPELYAERLSENTAMRTAVKQAAKTGMPIVAECGGFLYLHDTLTDRNGRRYAMTGVVSGECFDTGKLVRFGYVEMQEREGFFLPEGERIRGHEFHYYDSTDNGDGVLAYKPVTGKEYSCVMAGETFWMGFPHLYYPSNPNFARRFVEKAHNWI